MWPYVVDYRLDTEDSKEHHRAIVVAGDPDEAKRKINAFNVNAEKKSCVYIYSAVLMDENMVFDTFVDDLAYDIINSAGDMW